jgi:hypothetical protein
VEDFSTRQKSHFQAAKMMKSCSPEYIFSSAKFLMALEEFHFQANKTPNRCFVNARSQWVQGHMTIE